MALKQIRSESDTVSCPRCGGEAVIIDGHMIQWLTCTKCKFKKVLEKIKEDIKITPLRSDKEAKKLTKF